MKLEDIVDLLNQKLGIDTDKAGQDNVEFHLSKDDRIHVDYYFPYNDDRDNKITTLNNNIIGVILEIGEQVRFLDDAHFILKRDLNKYNIRPNNPTPEGEKLFKDAIHSLFTLEQFIRKDEKADVNRPMYRMRIGLGELLDAYKNNQNICDYVTLHELILGQR